MIYERVIQWIAGPFAVFIGGISAKWVSSWGFLGQIGLGHNSTAKSITTATVFVASSGVTYLAHHKWLDNLAKWWYKETGVEVPGFSNLNERLVTLEQNPALNQQTTPNPSTEPLSGDDNPNEAQVLQRRKDIADSMPMRDPQL